MADGWTTDHHLRLEDLFEPERRHLKNAFGGVKVAQRALEKRYLAGRF